MEVYGAIGIPAEWRVSFCNADVINPEPFDYFAGKCEQGLPQENSIPPYAFDSPRRILVWDQDSENGKRGKDKTKSVVGNMISSIQ